MYFSLVHDSSVMERLSEPVVYIFPSSSALHELNYTRSRKLPFERSSSPESASDTLIRYQPDTVQHAYASPCIGVREISRALVCDLTTPRNTSRDRVAFTYTRAVDSCCFCFLTGIGFLDQPLGTGELRFATSDIDP